MNIADRRKELNLTMKEVAEKVGVSEATVSRWESGNIANMKRNRIFALATVLQVDPVDIMNIDFCNKNINIVFDELYDLIQQLDIEDRAEIKGTVKQMLKSDKYKPSKKANA